MIKLPRLPYNWKDQPKLFERYWDSSMNQIEDILNQLLSIPIIQEALADLDTAVTNAQTAADTAQTAADAANTAAATANTAAATANSTATQAKSQSNLVSSYVTGLTLTATTTVVTVSAHTRVYADNTTVAVSGGTVSGLSPTTVYYIYYDDASRSGGSVTFVATTSEGTAAQTGNRHLVGKITTATAGTTTGTGTRPPGVGSIP